MKSILFVAVFFVCIWVGIGVWYLRSVGTRPTTIQKDEVFSSQPLPLLIDDCFVSFAPECPPPGGNITSKEYYQEISNLLSAKALPAVLSYKETHDPNKYPRLFSNINNGNNMSVVEMTWRVGRKTNISYMPLILLAQIQTEYYTREDAPRVSPFENGTESFFEQTQIAAEELSILLHTSKPYPPLVVGGTTYAVDNTLNAGSYALYSYLAKRSATPAEFERIVHKKYQDQPRNFYHEWKYFFSSDPVTQSPYFLSDEAGE